MLLPVSSNFGNPVICFVSPLELPYHKPCVGRQCFCASSDSNCDTILGRDRLELFWVLLYRLGSPLYL